MTRRPGMAPPPSSPRWPGEAIISGAADHEQLNRLDRRRRLLLGCHSDSALAAPAVLALSAVRAASDLSTRLDKHPPGSAREKDRVDKHCRKRNKPGAAMTAGQQPARE